jgi:hypothetical protein
MMDLATDMAIVRGNATPQLAVVTLETFAQPSHRVRIRSFFQRAKTKITWFLKSIRVYCIPPFLSCCGRCPLGSVTAYEHIDDSDAGQNIVFEGRQKGF